MKQLSIIVPAYNVSKYIEECLESITKDESIQKKLDIIVVNDGSTDDTLVKVRSFEERYPNCIRVIDKENGGHGSGINRGIIEAKGIYLKVLDSDDWMITENLKKLIDYIEKAKNKPDIIINAYEQIWESNGTKILHSLENIEPYRIHDLNILAKFGYRYTIHSLTIKTELYRNDVKKKIDEKTSYDDVQYVLYPVPYITNFIYLSDVIYQYRMGGTSQSVNFANMQKNRNKLKNILVNAWNYYSDVSSKMNHAQQEYYLKDMGYSVGDYLNLLFTLENVHLAKKEFFDFLEEIKFPTRYIANAKARFVIRTMGVFFGMINRWYRAKITV